MPKRLSKAERQEVEDQQREWHRCDASPIYFVDKYCNIYDSIERAWIPFRLWPEQAQTLYDIHNHKLTIVLKARQLGLTWLCLSYGIWRMLFRPAATFLVFSRRDAEAVHLLNWRLKGIYQRLPHYLQSGDVTRSSGHTFELANGSLALAFPTTAGDTYTATLALVDEADLVPDLGRLMGAVKPTIDAGGQMLLISRSDKSRPESLFKRMYKAAKDGDNEWHPIFLPWHIHPHRDQAWYEAQSRDTLENTGSLDALHEQYPNTDTEALSARVLDKRIPPKWLQKVYDEVNPPPEAPDDAPGVPGLTVFRPPERDKKYIIGADPAEGNPTSDESAATVLDRETGEQVAVLAGRFQPSTFGNYTDRVGRWYNGAPIMVERNNHGHAVLLWLNEHSYLAQLLGDDGKPGWLSNARGKSMMYDALADAVKDEEVLIHDFITYMHTSSIEGGSLRAPDGMHDDRASALALAAVAMSRPEGVLFS